MTRKNQSYSKEFKAEAVRTVLENQLSISEGASRLEVPEGTLGQWVTAARKGVVTPGTRSVAELESEVMQLRKALNEARLEREYEWADSTIFSQKDMSCPVHAARVGSGCGTVEQQAEKNTEV